MVDSLSVLASFLALLTKRPDKNNLGGGKIYLAITISKVSVHGWQTPLLWWKVVEEDSSPGHGNQEAESAPLTRDTIYTLKADSQ